MSSSVQRILTFREIGFPKKGEFFHQNLPEGIWLRMAVPLDTTPQELAQFLTDNRIPTSPEQISMVEFVDHRSATISVPKSTLAFWLTWLLSETPFRGERLLEFREIKRRQA